MRHDVLQVARERRGRRVPAFDAGIHRLRDHGLEVARNARVRGTNRRRVTGRDAARDLVRRRTLERQPQREQFVQRDREPADVRARVHVVDAAVDLLGRHVRQ